MQTQRFAALAQGLGTPGVRGPCWFRARGRRPGCHGTWMPGLEGPLGLWVHPHASAIRPGGPAGPRGGSLGPCLRDTQPGEEVQSGRGPEAHGVGQRDCGWGSRGYPPTWGGRSLEAPLVGRPLSQWGAGCLKEAAARMGQLPPALPSAPSPQAPPASPSSPALLLHQAVGPLGAGPPRFQARCLLYLVPRPDPRCPVPPCPPHAPLQHS